MIASLRPVRDDDAAPLAAEILTLARRHRWVIALVAVATVAAAFVTVQLLTERYETVASVLVKVGRENAEVPATVDKGGVFTTGVRKEEINSEVQVLSSPSLIGAVVDRLGAEAFLARPTRPAGVVAAVKFYIKEGVRWGKRQVHSALVALNLEKELNDRERAVVFIQDSLVVEPAKESDVIAIRMRTPDPALAGRVLETLLQLYRDEHIRLRREEDVLAVFEQEVQQRRVALEGLEAARQELRRKYGISSIPDQRLLLLRHAQELRTQQVTLENERAVVLAQQRQMQQRLAALTEDLPTSQIVTPNPSVHTIKERITNLLAQRAQMATRYAAGSEVLRNLDDEIGSLQRVLSDEKPTLVASTTSEANPLKRNFEQTIEQSAVRLAGIDASLTQLTTTAAEISERLRLLDAGEREIEQVERERKVAEENYLTYTKRGEEAYIDDQLGQSRIANISILQPPASSMQPVYPPKLLVVGLSVPFGLLLGFGFVLLREYFSDHINTPVDVETVEGVAYLETISLPDGQREASSTRPFVSSVTRSH